MEWSTVTAITCPLYITSATSTPGECRCSTTTSFHLVPTLERTTREEALPGKTSPFVRQRGILCGDFIIIFTPRGIRVKRSLPALRDKQTSSLLTFNEVKSLNLTV